MVAAWVPSSTAKRPFAAFVASSSEGLRRTVRADARRRGLPADVDVDDVVQTAFARLLPVYERLDTEYAAFNYACKTALTTLSDARKRARLRHEGWLESVYRRHARAEYDPEEAALRSLRAADVRQAFGNLPLSQRRAVALVDLEDLRQTEAADVMGVTPTVLKGLVQRGRERLRRDLSAASGIVALFRVRRSVLAPAATAPAFAVMAALMLTVGQTPAVPAPAPDVAIEAAPRPTVATAMSGPDRSAVATRATAAKARPAAPARTVKAKPAGHDSPPSAGRPAPASAGACVGDTCVGEDKGDTTCVHLPEVPTEPVTTPDACLTQSVVGVCPAVAPLMPVVTCTRDGEPAIDPIPGS